MSIIIIIIYFFLVLSAYQNKSKTKKTANAKAKAKPNPTNKYNEPQNASKIKCLFRIKPNIKKKQKIKKISKYTKKEL